MQKIFGYILKKCLLLLFTMQAFFAVADDYFQKGIETFEAKDYTLAIRYFSVVIKKDTTNAIAYFNRGLCYQELNHIDSAIYDFSKSYFLKPIDKQIENALLNVYFKRAMRYHDAKSYDAALQDFENYLLIKPDDDIVIFNKGIILSKQEQKLQAIDEYTKAITLNAKTEYYLNRAIDYFFLQKYTQALPDLNEVLKATPQDTTALWLRAKIYYEQNNFEQAQKDLTILHALQPQQAAVKDLLFSVSLTHFIEKNKYWGIALFFLFILGLYFGIRAVMRR